MKNSNYEIKTMDSNIFFRKTILLKNVKGFYKIIHILKINNKRFYYIKTI